MCSLDLILPNFKIILIICFRFLTCTFRASCYSIRLLEVNEREGGVVAIHLPIGSLKIRSGLEPVLRCEPSTYLLISR